MILVKTAAFSTQSGAQGMCHSIPTLTGFLLLTYMEWELTLCPVKRFTFYLHIKILIRVYPWVNHDYLNNKILWLIS